jgi:guanidinobutyrase
MFLHLGTPEVGGLTSIQAIEIIRGCKGLNVVGADVVEVWCS